METTNMSFIDKAVKGLRLAATELEEFQLQLALGKAEASDKYEEIKKSFGKFIHDAKATLDEKATASGLKAKFEELLLQLSLGKAETRDAFKEQEKRILKAIREIEDDLKKMKAGSELYLKFKSELETFRIKMEILRLRFELGKMDAGDVLEKEKEKFSEKVDEIKREFSDKKSVLEKNWSHFHNEMSEAYAHLKKAFTF